jgi:hypothetical protein
VIKGKEAEDEESLRVRLLAAEEEQVILEGDQDRDDEEDKDDRGEQDAQLGRPACGPYVGITCDRERDTLRSQPPSAFPAIEVICA